MENNERKDGLYTASFVLGLVGTLVGGLIISILGLIFSIKSRKSLKANNETNGMVTAGLVLSIIGLVKSIFVVGIVMLGIITSLVIGNDGIIERSRDAQNSYYNSGYSSSYYKNY